MTRAIQTIVVTDDAPAFDPAKRSLPIALHTPEGDPIDLSAGGGGGVGDVIPVEADSNIEDHLGSQWTLINADLPVQLTVKGTCHANANGDLGRLVLLVSGDNGATGKELDQFATTATTNQNCTLTGLVPAGWKAQVAWEQNAPGQGGSYNLGTPIVQPLG